MNGSSVIVYPSLAREIRYHLVSSLAFLLWDIIITSGNEMKHIWSKPRNSLFKWLYLYLRYISLTTQIFHQFFVPYLDSGTASRSTCFVWYTYASIISQLHTTAVEIILAVRVYALFNKSRRIAMILGLQMVLEYVMLVIMVVKYFPAIVFVPYCILAQPPYPVVYQTIAMLATQTTLLGLLLTKPLLARHAGWGRTPLVSILIRDGTTTYFIVCAIFFAVAFLCELRDERSVVVFFWITSITSSWGCRLIVNMQYPALDNHAHSTARFYITSQIEAELPSDATL